MKITSNVPLATLEPQREFILKSHDGGYLRGVMMRKEMLSIRMATHLAPNLDEILEEASQLIRNAVFIDYLARELRARGLEVQAEYKHLPQDYILLFIPYAVVEELIETS